MFNKSGLLLFVLTILQVSARYKNVVPDLFDDVINPEAASLSSSRIISGWEAKPGQHPHHAALRMVASTGDMRVCGGSIISNEWVLTAARCVVSRVLAVVRVGVVDINDSNPDHIFETSEWYTHPRFNNLSTALQSHGVTLLKLQQPLVFTWLVQPIRIQSSADAYRNYDGELAYASGHGRTSTMGPDSNMLRWVYLRVISNSECARTSPNNVFETTICARYSSIISQSTCYGDNGGPLVHVGADGIPTLIGITFFFPAVSIGCDVGRPTGFYRPGAFLPWFKEVTGIDFDKTNEITSTTTTPTTTTSTTTTTTTTIPTTTTTTTTPSTTTITPSTTTTTTPSTTTTTIPSTTTSTTTPSTTNTTPSTTTTTTPSTTTPTTIPSTTTTTTTTTPTTIPSTTTTTTTPSTTTTTPSTTTTTIPSTTTTTPSTTTTTTPSTTTTTPSTTTTTTPSTTTTTPSTTTTTPSTTTTTTPSTTITTPTPTTIPSITTDSDQGPEDFTPEDNTTAPPDDEEKEDEEESDSSECNDDDEMGQLLKRLQVDVKVKVALNKYKVMKMNDTSVLYH